MHLDNTKDTMNVWYSPYKPIYCIAQQLCILKLSVCIKSGVQYGKSHIPSAHPQGPSLFVSIIYLLQVVQLWLSHHSSFIWRGVQPVSEFLYLLPHTMGGTIPNIHGHIWSCQRGSGQHHLGPYISNKVWHGGSRGRKHGHNSCVWVLFTGHQWILNTRCRLSVTRHRVTSCGIHYWPIPDQCTPMIPLASLRHSIDPVRIIHP